MPPAILAADAEGGKARRGPRSEPPGYDACLAERRWPHDRRNFQGAAGADSARARLGDADSNVRRTARPLAAIAAPENGSAAPRHLPYRTEALMIRGLVEILLLKKFPKLTLFGLAAAALIGAMRAKRPQ